MNIFIPVLWICINSNCEFMAPDMHYNTELECMNSIDDQKQHMKNLVKKTGKGTIKVLEGTCVTTKIDLSKRV